MTFRILTFMSLTLFVAFNAVTIIRHGLQPSYSSTYYRWWRSGSLSVFSIITFTAAFLLMPPLIEVGAGSALQCLGFFAPLYLMVVAMSPDFLASRRDNAIHTGAAIVCAICSLFWLFAVRKLWWVVLIVLAVTGLISWLTRSYRTSLVFWLEVVLFMSVYAALIFCVYGLE